MLHRRFLALGLLAILAAIPACSQSPSAPAAAAAIAPAPGSSQVLTGAADS